MMMKAARWLAWMLVVVMAVSPMAVFAQGDDALELVEVTTEDELLVVSLPEEWLVMELEDFPFPHLAAANSEEALDRLNSDDGDLESGDQLALVMVLPLDLFALMGAEMPEESDPAQYAAMFATLFLEPEEGAPAEEFDAVVIGEPEAVELDDERVIGFVAAADATAEGAFLAHDLGDGLLLLVFVAAYPDEFTDELGELGVAVIASAEFTGTADELMAAFMGVGVEVEEAPEGMTSSDYDGAALVAERCSVCHTLDRVNNATKDEAGWTTTVDRMIGNGAQLNAAEREAVIAYLSSK